MTASKKQAVIIVVIVLAAIIYFYFKKSYSATQPSTGSATTPPASTDPSAIPQVSQPAPVSQQLGVTTPVVLPNPVTSFISRNTDAQIQGTTGTAQQSAAPSMPPGFTSWYNSLGPQNQAYVLSIFPNMTSDEINLVNSIVLNNGWGKPQYTSGWNAFVSKYGLPKAGKFSSYYGSKSIQKTARKGLKK